ncbi:DUF6586 family protein [Pseudomonas boanensis]|uniref:PasA protein n=1 Tax=Metapseudomonas boanensis TaxID=2822138 RepID=A0ABS5XBV7_9GAMM|nr:DUF6586 family protein [Pseudomonas boanensis]MBT8765175.1 PasA protein [Pseudomonas boanensis]
MAHERYTRTNQKLFFAGLSLEAWRKAEEARAMNAQAVVQAEREAALFHLYGALLGLCHEIAGYYRLSEADEPRVESLLKPEVLAAAPCPELSELLELAQNPETWLAQLLDSYAALFQPPQAPKVAKVDPTLPLIPTVKAEDAADAAPLSPATLEEWRQSLKGLALRFRESLSEC